MHFIELVPICNDSSLTYFFDHDDEDNTPIFYLLPVSNVILNRASNHKHSHINKKTRSPTTTATALLTTTSSVTSITKQTNPVSVLASKPTPIQVKQPTLNSYYPCTDGIFAYNPAMNIHYHAIRHSYLLLNQNQVYVPILLSTKHRKKSF